MYLQKHNSNTDQLLRLWHGKLFLSFLDSFTGSALTVLCHYLFIVTKESVLSYYTQSCYPQKDIIMVKHIVPTKHIQLLYMKAVYNIFLLLYICKSIFSTSSKNIYLSTLELYNFSVCQSSVPCNKKSNNIVATGGKAINIKKLWLALNVLFLSINLLYVMMT